MSLNKAMIIGNLRPRPGDAVYAQRAGVSAVHGRRQPATTRTPAGSGRKRPSVRVVAWGRLRSGPPSTSERADKVYVEVGSRPVSWEDKDGQKRTPPSSSPTLSRGLDPRPADGLRLPKPAERGPTR